MGSNWTPEQEFKCANDCEQSGCPGHKMKIEYHRGSDIVTVWVDGEPLYYFDDNRWSTMLELAHKGGGE